MSYLMHICFDNDQRLARNHYLFNYKGTRFKLIQNNPGKWSNHLLTILPDSSEQSRDTAFGAASEFLSALCWELQSKVIVWECGGTGWQPTYPLSQAKPSIFDLPRIPPRASVNGSPLSSLPKIDYEYQRVALTLFREASASNNDYLSFLFYWQVLETRNTDAIGYVDKVYRKKRKELKVAEKYVSVLPLIGRTLGNYLKDDCRNAIAHIRRRPGRKKLDLDKATERTRISKSTRVVKAFARHYIEHSLGLSQSLYLVRKSDNSFPVFADKESIARNGYRAAYKIY